MNVNKALKDSRSINVNNTEGQQKCSERESGQTAEHQIAGALKIAREVGSLQFEG